MFIGSLITAPGIFPIRETPVSTVATNIQWADPLEHSDWDSRLKSHPANSFFHNSAWANVLAETYGFKPIYFVANEKNAVHSLLPLMEVDSRLTGRRGVALPFTDNCEPPCPDLHSFKNLFRNAVEIGKLRGWDYLEIRGGQRFFNGTPPSLAFYGHTLDLPADENALFGQLASPVRRAIRKAEKEGVRVEISQEFGAVKTFYSLQCKARKRHGLPPQPFSFFKNIHKHVLEANMGFVALARRKKTPIAGAMYFHSGESAIYKFGASDEKFQHLRGNNLVMWEAIRRLSQEGMKKLDLGRTSVGNDGLRRFKLGWNAQEKPICYFRFSLDKDKFIPVKDEASGWHNRIFRTLPIAVSRLFGKVLYRHWA
ncbi:MAG TPA: GNAT family N-acetyltransferase [Verrucomicrobiae bacterium]